MRVGRVQMVVVNSGLRRREPGSTGRNRCHTRNEKKPGRYQRSLQFGNDKVIANGWLLLLLLRVTTAIRTRGTETLRSRSVCRLSDATASRSRLRLQPRRGTCSWPRALRASAGRYREYWQNGKLLKYRRRVASATIKRRACTSDSLSSDFIRHYHLSQRN